MINHKHTLIVVFIIFIWDGALVNCTNNQTFHTNENDPPPYCNMPGSSSARPECAPKTSTAAPTQKPSTPGSQETDQKAATRLVRIMNGCSYPIWMKPVTSPPSPSQITDTRRIEPNGETTYLINGNGWEGQFIPKLKCDQSGERCEVGQTLQPCPPDNCDPATNTLIEFFWPPENSNRNTYHDVSLVDGYSIPAAIYPRRQNFGACVPATCGLSLNECPTDEPDAGDLGFRKNGRVTNCFSPCKKWATARDKQGLGRNEQEEPGRSFCCPHPVTVEQCRQGRVTHTKYVQLVHNRCPSAYAYSYDDHKGSHDCPSDTGYDVRFC